jgi:hypothetical protein
LPKAALWISKNRNNPAGFQAGDKRETGTQGFKNLLDLQPYYGADGVRG